MNHYVPQQKQPSLSALSRGPEQVISSHWKTVLPPLLLLSALVGFLYFIFRDYLRPAIPVEAAQVILLEEHESSAPTSSRVPSELLFQASGWVEPDPWPVRVSVYTDGIVQEVLVKEGERVRAGDVVARLDDMDARLALDVKRHALAMAEAAVAERSAAIESAQFEHKGSLATLEGARARLHAASDAWQRLAALGTNNASRQELIAAEQSEAVHLAEVQVAQRRAEALGAEIRRLQAALKRDEALVGTVDKEIEIAELRLARMTVYAPMDGMVLRRYVEPGAKRGIALDNPDSATILTLFDPARLQVRVDVPLSEAGRLRTGQPVRVGSALIGGVMMSGAVSRIAGEADLQRNTLQAKVAIHQPDMRLRPEVLCRAEFWSLPGKESAPHEDRGIARAERRGLWAPEAAFNQPDTLEGDVWVVAPGTRVVERRTVRLARERRPGLRRVEEGLRANELLVTYGAERLTPGARVSIQPTGETTL
ncbi:MAG: HlyD family efflux transporter periplasmic adaptor subunit [Spartobacteria bacterium]|nr:HlyD family efflux transporter periplasmic adaptor subunit [Spartobacteria bacterium]